MIGTRKQLTLNHQIVSYIEFEANNEAIPILFLHGWGGSAMSFQALWQELINGQIARRLIAIDFPGFGRSPAPTQPWNVHAYAECVVKYLDVLHIKQVILVSHSFGGRVTTKLLYEHPNRVRRVVYIAPAGIRNHEKRIGVITRLATAMKVIFELPLLNRLFPTVKKWGYMLIGGHDYLHTSGVMKQTFQNVIAEDLSPVFETITQPVKIFWGQHDSYVPVEQSEFMKNKIPHADVRIFGDGRHGIHTTHAQQIAEDIVAFLAE
ncbi:MAG: alpha/beta hydrolase [Candidatus Kerfeldbacteria bacterium]|nr:alpha/beta hydrolase [Candidatus Kerfeldbacteria bacterium]